MINQREVGIDVPDFTLGMRAVLRQDPDIMLVGEMRDSETFSTALSAAETGHYVLGTLHSSNAQQAVQRLFEFYPVEQHPGLRRQVASSLRAAITQRLVPALEGQGLSLFLKSLLSMGLAAPRSEKALLRKFRRLSKPAWIPALNPLIRISTDL